MASVFSSVWIWEMSPTLISNKPARHTADSSFADCRVLRAKGIEPPQLDQAYVSVRVMPESRGEGRGDKKGIEEPIAEPAGPQIKQSRCH